MYVSPARKVPHADQGTCPDRLMPTVLSTAQSQLESVLLDSSKKDRAEVEAKLYICSPGEGYLPAFHFFDTPISLVFVWQETCTDPNADSDFTMLDVNVASPVSQHSLHCKELFGIADIRSQHSLPQCQLKHQRI